MVHIIDLHFYQQKDIIAAFLLETSMGPVLIETGPFSTFDSLKKGLNKIGYSPEDIQHVLLTHIHLDHAGAAWWFAKQGATIYVHPKGYSHLHDPSKLMDSAKRIYQDMMDTLWGEMKAIPKENLVAVEDNEVLVIGDKEFKALHTPGHAVHHIAWQCDKVLFSGDVGGVKINDGPVVPPCPPPDIHVEDWQKSLQVIRNLDVDKMYLTHYGMVDDVPNHLEQLEQRLLNWANWIKPYFEEETSIAEITPLFQKMVQNELKSLGVKDEIQLGCYEAANPSWMSVTGLIRYWKKKNQ